MPDFSQLTSLQVLSLILAAISLTTSVIALLIAFTLR